MAQTEESTLLALSLWTQILSPKRLALSPKRLALSPKRVALSRMSRVLIERVYFSVLELNFRPYNTHQKNDFFCSKIALTDDRDFQKIDFFKSQQKVNK